MRCPICGVELKREVCGTEYGIEEEYDDCKSGCSLYRYQFAYGNSLTTIGKIEVMGHYTDSKEDIKFLSKIQDMAIEHERGKLGLPLGMKECEEE